MFQSQGNPQGQSKSSAEMTVTMTGKERQEYEAWKREREKIDQERIRRHQQAMADQRMQWKPGQESAEDNQEVTATKE